VIKTRNFPQTPKKSVPKSPKIRNTVSLMQESACQLQEHFELLKSKKRIVKESLTESKAFLIKK
jgi:hypothetical protein